MCPMLPEDSFEKRRLPSLIVPSVLLAAAAVFYFFYRKKFIRGIDTPVVITGGSLTLFSDTPLTPAGYDIDPGGTQISHKKDKKIVRITVVDYVALPWVNYSPLTEADYKSPALIWWYDREVKEGCDVEAVYTGGAGEDRVRVSPKSNHRVLKIKFKRKRFNEYNVLDERTRRHPDGDNKLTNITIENGGRVDDLPCPSGRCEIRFTYKD